MSEPRWTENQKRAIEEPANVLVNAAAGSGKTAVLVERITKKIISGKTSIPRLLIVTFAKDAAAQMQTRLKKALMKCREESDDEELKARMKTEIRLLKYCDITTIDAFCIKVVRKNFHILGIDPDFKIIDASEADVLLNDAIDEFVDFLYESGDERIEKLSDLYSDGFNDYSLKAIMTELFKFTRSLPEPAIWLRANAQKYECMKNTDWYLMINNQISELFCDMKEKISDAVFYMTAYALGKAKDICDLTEDEEEVLEFYDNKGLWGVLKKAYLATLSSDASSREGVLNAVFSYQPFDKAYMSGDNKEERKEIIDKYNEAYSFKDKLIKLCEGSENSVFDMYEKGIYPQISMLTEVVCEFEDFYFEKKRRKNNFEFNDLEHLCFKLLKEHPDVRAEYNKKYDEILMDEYQDTNELQDSIFDLILDKKFMVGDMKQSIYRFRNSDPFIFKNKDRLYTENEDEGRRIILSENFRSRPQVLKSINEIFRRIMSEKAGEVTYDDTQELHWGNKDYTDEDDERFFSELYILEGKDEEIDEESLSDVEIEADFVAKKIREMIESEFLISDKEGMRPVNAGDFVIIRSEIKNSGAIFLSALKRYGLDGYTENESYFERTEIKLMLALLEILNNPLQDIPLVAVMRSILFGFSEDELALIRLCRKGDFFDAVVKMSKDSSECGQKCREFCEKIYKWREFSKYMSSDKLIWTIFEETDFYDLMAVLYDGEETKDNLRLLFEYARMFEKTGFKGLASFVMYMKRMEKNAKMASATVISDNNNVVRIMTIHKSKGLEFPVCIFSGLGKHFNAVKAGKLLLHKDLGIGIDYVDSEHGYFTHTAVSQLIKDAKKAEERAETLRKLYVGMTRAKEKLIMVGTVGALQYDKKGEVKSGILFEKQKWNTLYNPDLGVMKPETVLKVTRYFDMLAPIILHYKKDCGWKVFEIEYAGNKEIESTEELKAENGEISDDLIDEIFGNKLIKNEKEYIPGKISVTELERLYNAEKTDDDISDSELEDKHSENNKQKRNLNLKRPKFLQDGGLTGAERGTAYHTVFSLIDTSGDLTEKGVFAQMESFYEKGLLSAEAIECVSPVDIASFFKSELGKRVIKSDKIYREEPFEILVNSKEALNSSEEREILLQGVIDLMFEEEEKLVLVDYKTDKGLSENEFCQYYKNQLMWYKKAAEQLMGKKIEEVYLYSVDKQKEIKLL